MARTARGVAAMSGVRVLVCGGRDNLDRAFVFAMLDQVLAKHPLMAICHGGATGVDQIAGEWASTHDVPVTEFAADWSLGSKAGPLRNARMLDEFRPTGVVAFPGGRGTADMTRQAEAAGLPVWRPVAEQRP